MIYFFPMPYPDESLYNIFLRYDKLTGNNSYYTTISELLGSRKLRMNFSFPNNLSHLCKELPGESEFTPEYFVQNHTVLPLYKPFLTENKYMYVKNNFISGSIKSALPIVGNNTFMMNSINSFKYCPSCITDDKEIYGEAYLHRIHQVDGNLFCNKHMCMLNVYNTPRKLLFYDINKLNLQNHISVHSNEIYKRLSNLGYDMAYFFDFTSSLPSHNIVQNKFYSRLFDKGYVIAKGIINQKKLHEDFIDFYSHDFLDLLKSNASIDNPSSWLKIITQTNANSLVHPIKYLLFIRFLFEGIQEFTNYSYHKVEIHKRQSNEIKIYRKEQILALQGDYKNNKLTLMHQEPNLSRSEINNRLKKECSFIYRHDKDWLESILPQSHRNYIVKQDYWKQKDIEWCALAYDVISELLGNDKFDRITINLIEHLTNNSSLHKNIEKMPKTQALIEKYKESIPEFHMRKIKIAIKNNKKKGIQIKPYKILREVHIPPNYRRNYVEYINSLIENI